MADEVLPPWSAIHEIDGCLPMRWQRQYSHGLTFQFFAFDDPETEPDKWDVQATVKWDGCVNWETNKSVMYHFCDAGDLKRLASSFLAAWEITKTELPTADFDLITSSLTRID